VQRRCGRMSKYFDHLLLYTTYALMEKLSFTCQHALDILSNCKTGSTSTNVTWSKTHLNASCGSMYYGVSSINWTCQ